MPRPASGYCALFGLVAALMSPGAQAQDVAKAPASFVLQATGIDVPADNRMFTGGARADAINNNCLACHSAGMVLNQPALSRTAWEAEVRKMINVYRAPVAEADVGAIVDYLAAMKPGDQAAPRE